MNQVPASAAAISMLALIAAVLTRRYRERRDPTQRKPIFMITALAVLLAATVGATLLGYAVHSPWPLVCALAALGLWAVAAAWTFGEHAAKHGPWQG